MSEIGTENRSRIEIRVRFKGKLYEMSAESDPEDTPSFIMHIQSMANYLHAWVEKEVTNVRSD